MSTVTFWLVALLTAAKIGVIPTPKPFEWVGELATGTIAMTIAAVCALAVHLYVGDVTPPEVSPMVHPGALPWSGVWA